MMSNGFFNVLQPANEPVLSYKPGSTEREALKAAIHKARTERADKRRYIGGRKVHKKDKFELQPPNDKHPLMTHFSKGTHLHVQDSIDAPITAQPNWKQIT